MTLSISGTGKECLTGKFTVPGDKSISHRSVMLGAMAEGTTEVDGFLTGEDCLSTINCFRALGVDIKLEGTDLTVKGTGRLSAPSDILDVGNSGTTLRLMTGLLAGQPFTCTMTGDESIQKRPMKRVVDPLTMMGAKISNVYAPVTIEGQPLKGIEYTLPVASAQVKSAIILAGLYAEGQTVIEEPTPTRDHTEIMLRHLGADIAKEGNRITIRSTGQRIRPVGDALLKAQPISVPGDISSAAFLLAAAAILPGSHITIEGVGVNPTRTGIIYVLKRMGADIRLNNERIRCGEPVADIEIRHAPLKGTTIGGSEIPTLIDEIPIIAAVALFAKGQTMIKDAEELRVKETDRIQVVAEEFGKFFEEENPIKTQPDGMTIQPAPNGLKGAKVSSRGDHRLAMSLSILGLAAMGETVLSDAECADVSFPNFYKTILRENSSWLATRRHK